MLKDYLNDCITSADYVCEYLGITGSDAENLKKSAEIFPMLVTGYYLSLINKNDPEDPIKKMCIPSAGELSTKGVLFSGGEDKNTRQRGIQHKYGPTALTLSTSRCAAYCRFCFRRRFVGSTEDEVVDSCEAVRDYVLANKNVDNVLISGGDSFVNENSTLRTYLELLSPLEQLDFIRFGTRTPVVCPKRIYNDSELIELLTEFCKKKQIYIITHFNHPNEITDESKKAISALLSTGACIKNQTVLMRGINDKPEILASLCKKLSACGVVPYYIFQCRPIRGVTTTFSVPIAEGYEIVQQARKVLNGPAKQFRYAMSHYTGKIEIIGKDENGRIILQYHQAKNPEDTGKIFMPELAKDQTWLD